MLPGYGYNNISGVLTTLCPDSIESKKKNKKDSDADLLQKEIARYKIEYFFHKNSTV